LYLTLGMLSEGGITIVQAISTVQDMVSPGMRSSLQAARLSIEAGLPLSTSFEVNDLTTPISLRMLRVGERTGDMGPMLSQSAAFYDGEISRWIERFTRTFEPLLMAAIGLVVGAIVVLLYMPIFDLAGDIS
jgi:general secretion pathway protein F